MLYDVILLCLNLLHNYEYLINQLELRQDIITIILQAESGLLAILVIDLPNKKS